MIVFCVLGYIIIGMVVAMGIDALAGLEKGNYPFRVDFWPILRRAVLVCLPLILAGFAAKELVFAIRRWEEGRL